MNIFKIIKSILNILKWMVISSIIGVFGALSSIIITIIVSTFSTDVSFLLIPEFFIIGLIVGYLPELKGSGINITLKALSENKKLSLISGILKVILSGFTIAVGGSAGKVGPCIQCSASFADYIGNKLHLKNREMILITGISGGLSGTFDAPLGTAILSCEIIEHEGFKYNNVFPAMIASIVGYMAYNSITGEKHLFPTVNNLFNNIVSPIYIIWYILAGFFCSFIMYGYIKTFKKISSFFNKINIPDAFKMSFAAIILLIIYHFAPFSSGLGSNFLNSLFTIKLPLSLIVITIIGKILSTSFTIGSGCPGGLLFPSIVIGALSGLIFSTFFGLNSIPFIILGIATGLSSVANVPLGSAVLSTEMFGMDFAVPIIIGTVIGYYMTKLEYIFEYIEW